MMAKGGGCYRLLHNKVLHATSTYINFINPATHATTLLSLLARPDTTHAQ